MAAVGMEPCRAVGPGKVAATEEANEHTTPAAARVALARHEQPKYTTSSGHVKGSVRSLGVRFSKSPLVAPAEVDTPLAFARPATNCEWPVVCQTGLAGGTLL